MDYKLFILVIQSTGKYIYPSMPDFISQKTHSTLLFLPSLMIGLASLAKNNFPTFLQYNNTNLALLATSIIFNDLHTLSSGYPVNCIL
jgi:uncharacterized protein YsxB (DUF464 family)